MFISLYSLYNFIFAITQALCYGKNPDIIRFMNGIYTVYTVKTLFASVTDCRMGSFLKQKNPCIRLCMGCMDEVNDVRNINRWE